MFHLLLQRLLLAIFFINLRLSGAHDPMVSLDMWTPYHNNCHWLVLYISAVFLFFLFGGIACFHRRLLFITACHGLSSVIPCWNKTKTNKILPTFLMNEWKIKRRNWNQHFTKTFYVLFRRKYKIWNSDLCNTLFCLYCVPYVVSGV